MITGIYALFDAETKKCLYVGQSKNIETRYFEHLKCLKNGNHKRKDFVSWFHEKNLNPDSIVCCLLEECLNTDAEKNMLEIKWFNELSPRFFGKHPSLNEKWAHTEDSKNNISISVKRNLLNNGIVLQKIICCRLCKKKTKNKEVCENCKRRCDLCKFTINYKNLITNMYLNEKLPTREIGRRLNLDYRNILKVLKLWKIEIEYRSFNGRKHSQKVLKRIGSSTVERSLLNAFYGKCLNCKQEFRFRKSQPRKFCSRKCYLEFAN